MKFKSITLYICLLMLLFALVVVVQSDKSVPTKKKGNDDSKEQGAAKPKREILNSLDEDGAKEELSMEKKKALLEQLIKLGLKPMEQFIEVEENGDVEGRESQFLIDQDLEVDEDDEPTDDITSSSGKEEEIAVYISYDDLIDRMHDSGGEIQDVLQQMVKEARDQKNLDQLISKSNNNKQQQSPEDQKKDELEKLKQKKKEEIEQAVQFAEKQKLGFEDKSFVFSPTNKPADTAAATAASSATSIPSLPGQDLFIQGQRRRGYVLLGKSEEDQTKDRFQYVGSETDIDMERSIQLLTESASLGNHKAMFILGTMEEMGEIGIINFKKAAEWYNQSAGLGNSDAQYALAFLYATGKGVEMSDAKSILYLTFAARSGHVVAKMSLAYRYFYGYGTPKSCQKAAHLYEEVAKKVVDDFESRGFVYQVDVERFSDQQQHLKAAQPEEESVVDYFKYSASLGDPDALVTMANLHLQGGLGVTQDVRAAFGYYREAAAQNNAAGVAGLGFMYAKGYGVEQSNDTAARYYKRAADMGHLGAQSNLAEMYLHGWGVAKNVKHAFKLFSEAAKEGDVDAQINLGKMYLAGQHVPKDVEKALGLFQMAATQGNPAAVYHHASLGYQHQPSPSMCSAAVFHFKRVAERGQWAQILTQAQQLFDQGDDERALLFFEKAAEMGVEVAQNNAAWMYDQKVGTIHQEQQDNEQNTSTSTSTTVIENDAMAFRYYQHSAEQHNPTAHLKLGDYYYYGRAGEIVDQERAADLYQRAASLQNAQALFNLGYMHQFGLGRQQDFFLAKRYYDMALTHQPNAYIPVYLALGSLWTQYYYHYAMSYLSGQHDHLLDASTTSTPPITTPLDVEGQQGTPTPNAEFLNDHNINNYEKLKKSESTNLLFSVDSYFIFVLAIILGYLVIRRQRINLRGGNNGNQQPQPQNR